MARLVSEELSHLGAKDKLEEALGGWYMSRKEIEENSPSRKDGIGLKKEAFLRESYCTFLKDLGKRLKVRQITIATAIIFCHRFFLRQSHSKNDQWTIATVCMFLACKVEETPHPLKNVIRVSYEVIHEKDPAAAQRIKQKAVYEQQKELILLGERVVLATLGFDLNVQHPYEPLFKAIKKFNVAKYALLQVAWNFVNDGLSTSLCLQFKPNHIAASAIFLAAKFLKVKLPSDGEKVWWQEFDVTPRQLEEVSNQLLEFYKQNRIPPSQGSEAEGAAVGGTRAATKAPATNEKQASKHISSHPAPQHSSVENNAVLLRGTKNQSNDGSTEWGSDITDPKMDLEIRDSQNSEKLPQKDNKRELTNRSKSWTAQIVVGDQHRMFGRNLECWEGPLGHSYSSKEAIKMIDKDKLKVALGKRRKKRGEMTINKEVMDEDDLIERELEDGVELAFKNEKNRRERRQNWSKLNDEDHGIQKGQLQKEMEEHNAEEGEMIDNAASLLNNRKRGIESPPARQPLGRNLECWEGPLGHSYSSKEAIKMIDKDKLKVALGKRRKK